MSRPNTAYAEPRERDDDVVVTEPAPLPFLPSGAAVLVARIYACGVEAKAAADALATDAATKTGQRAIMNADITLTFSEPGDFAAFNAARAFLRARRFSVGPMQGNDPIAALFGANLVITKWRHIGGNARAAVHATLTAADMRAGPVKLTIFAHAPAAARTAVSKAA